VVEYLKAVNAGVAQNNPLVARETENASKRIKSEVKQLRRRHLEELSRGDIAPQVSVAFLAALNAYARVRDHLETIAETVSREV
jgi:phosphate:Na+ symporter